jgi:PST family polysaccharide transporter
VSLEKKNILKNFSYLVITKGVDFIVPIILLPYLVNALGLSQFGLLSFALAIGVYFSSMMQYGYNISAVRTIARVRDDAAQLSLSFSELLISSILICTFFSGCYLLLFFIEAINNEHMLYLSVLFFVLMQSLFPAWLFQGIEKMHYIAMSNSLCKFLYLCSVLYWVNNPGDVYLVPLLQGISWLIALVIAVVIVYKKQLVSIKIPSWGGVLATYKQGWPAFVTQFSPTLYSNSMTFILGIFHGNTIVGIYSAAVRVIEIVNAMAFLLVNAALPLLSRNIALHKWLKNTMVMSGIVLYLFVIFGSPWFLPVLFSVDSGQILELVQLAALMIPFVFIRMAYGPAYLMLVGAEKSYQRIVLLISLSGFIIAWLVIPQWQIKGAIYVMLSTTVVMTLMTYIAFNRFENRKKVEQR